MCTVLLSFMVNSFHKWIYVDIYRYIHIYIYIYIDITQKNRTASFFFALKTRKKSSSILLFILLIYLPLSNPDLPIKQYITGIMIIPHSTQHQLVNQQKKRAIFYIILYLEGKLVYVCFCQI